MRNCGLVVVLCGLVVMASGRIWGQSGSGQSPAASDQNSADQSGQDQQSNQTQSQKNPGQTSAPQTPGPQTSGEEPKKEENGNPVQAVAVMTKDAATAGLLRARDWESGWIAGVYVGRRRKLVTLTGPQRREIYLQQTLITPEAYMKRMFGAGIDQTRGVPPQWDDGWTGYLERFASREGQFITANTLAYIGNAKLGYEVRYDQCKCKGWPRLKHAVMRNFLTYDRSEENLRPQWALYGGAFAGGLVATSWKPRSQSALVNGGWALLGQAAYGTLLNVVTEFSREINRKQGVK
jgi:hypothetical protein